MVRPIFLAPTGARGVMMACVRVFDRDIMLRMALKEFLQNSKECRGGLGIRQANKLAGK